MGKILVSSKSPDEEINLSKFQIYKEIVLGNTYACRYVKNFDKKEVGEYWYIIRDKFIHLEKMKSAQRGEFKKGLENYDIFKIDPVIYINDIFEIHKKCTEEYNNRMQSKEVFKEDFLETYKGEMHNVWGVISKETNKLIGYSLVVKIPIHHMKNYASYSLFYTIDKYYLEKCNFKFCSDGARNIFHNSNIQDYLQKKHNYRKAYCDLVFYLHPIAHFMMLTSVLYIKVVEIFNLQRYEIINKKFELFQNLIKIYMISIKK
uniref:hypothetical protein n=1 Tax=Flavobacterium sp. TaxID=239 RepID=UPI00404716EF